MIALWMVYAMIVSLLFALAAHAAEYFCHLWRTPRRFVWAGALAASAFVPSASLLVARDPSKSSPLSVVRLPARIVTLEGEPSRGIAPWVRALDATILVLWGMATLGLTVAVWRRQRALDRLRSTWSPARILGREVLLSEHTGPAVFGLRESTVVLPKWILDLDPPLLELVLAHEREHARVGDPRLLVAATLLVIAMPWNLASWWQLRRLRLALELDCDARVLRRSADVRRYATLLIAVGQRLRSSSFSLVTLGEPSAHLRERITIMSAPKPRYPVLQSLVVVPIAMLALVVACAAPNPGARKAGEGVTPQVAAEAVIGGRSSANSPSASTATDSRVYFEFEVEIPVKPAGGSFPAYPADLKAAGTEGQVLAQFVVDETGQPVPASFKVLASSHGKFTEAVQASIPGMRFTPALVKGRPVRQLVQQPFRFALAPKGISRIGSAGPSFALWAPPLASRNDDEC